LQSGFEQTVLGTVGREHVVADIEKVGACRRCARLLRHIQLAAQIPLFFFDAKIIASHAALDHVLQCEQKLSHHPLG